MSECVYSIYACGRDGEVADRRRGRGGLKMEEGRG